MPSGRTKPWRDQFGRRLPNQGFALSGHKLSSRLRPRQPFQFLAHLLRMFRSADARSSGRQVVSFRPLSLLLSQPRSPLAVTSRSRRDLVSALRGGWCRRQPPQPNPSLWRLSGTFSDPERRSSGRPARSDQRQLRLASCRLPLSFAGFAGCHGHSWFAPTWSFRPRQRLDQSALSAANHCPLALRWVRQEEPAAPPQLALRAENLTALVGQPRSGRR
jgi:hypothetical protein